MVSTEAGVSPPAVGNSGTQFDLARWSPARPGIMIPNRSYPLAGLGAAWVVAGSWFAPESAGCV